MQKLRVGSKHVDLDVFPDAFRNELFTSTANCDLAFNSIVSHRAEVKVDKTRASQEAEGPDAALLMLQNDLASLKQEKESRQANITNTLIVAPKNRYDAARKERLNNKSTRPGVNNGSRIGSPAMTATASPYLGPAPTSAPTSQDDVRLRAMRTPLIHLLATESLASAEIYNKTRIPKAALDTILQRIGKKDDVGKWHLSDKAFRELDVWKFEYPSRVKRQAAIDNAIRAYDRMRVDKDSILWQQLLPREERGKGKILSRLQLGAGQINRGLTPNYQSSQTPHMENADDSRAASAANTPRPGALTPRPGSSAGDVKKRLLAKDPAKARAVEQAKEKKRKERDAAASDPEGGRPAKKQVTKKANVKSEEFVHSSDEEGDAESGSSRSVGSKQSSRENQKSALKTKPKAPASRSSDKLERSQPAKEGTKAPAKARPATDVRASLAVNPTKAEIPGKSTPQPKNNLSAPSSQQRTQRSPSNSGNRPGVPSPLGAARPRVASDVSDRSAVGVKHIRQGAGTPNGLGITNGITKQADTAGRVTTSASSKRDKEEQQTTQQHKSRPPGTTANGNTTPQTKSEPGTKRKAEAMSPAQESSEQASKHRKTESTSSNLRAPDLLPNGLSNDHSQASPDGQTNADEDTGMPSSLVETITFKQGVKVAIDFQKHHPIYDRELAEQQAAKDRGEELDPEVCERLWRMYRTLKRMKEEMYAASKREFD